jgi:hypothetical protein
MQLTKNNVSFLHLIVNRMLILHSTSHVNIADDIKIQISEKWTETTPKKTLKRVHTAIGNAKKNFVGNYHKIKKEYLQLYLNAFVYKRSGSCFI